MLQNSMHRLLTRNSRLSGILIHRTIILTMLWRLLSTNFLMDSMFLRHHHRHIPKSSLNLLMDGIHWHLRFLHILCHHFLVLSWTVPDLPHCLSQLVHMLFNCQPVPRDHCTRHNHSSKQRRDLLSNRIEFHRPTDRRHRVLIRLHHPPIMLPVLLIPLWHNLHLQWRRKRMRRQILRRLILT